MVPFPVGKEADEQTNKISGWGGGNYVSRDKGWDIVFTARRIQPKLNLKFVRFLIRNLYVFLFFFIFSKQARKGKG